ncbi:MAG: threonine synthase [Planctomycetes bacterium]|nr:threonine synthase [Planctomycetota bacterium]
MFVSHLSCWGCGRQIPAEQLVNLCPCGKPLRVEYDLDRVREAVSRDEWAKRPPGLWRYREVLPLAESEQPVTLGEGATPLLPAPRIAELVGVERIYIKDEAVNPTGSFKARGMTAAVTMARVLGARSLAVPSAGNAGGALAAYAAAAGLSAHVFMPRDVPQANCIECELAGAEVTLIDGLIHDCARALAERKETEDWFDVSTLKEPYRVEGKKTLGYELAEQLGWTLPDVIIYPTGGGTGLIGMAKAFDEMEALGWIGSQRPRFVVVQSTGCAPIVRAFDEGRESAALWEEANTVAAGLRVPKAIADFVILRYLRAGGGTAVAIADEELIRDARALSAATGICACPEGGACLSAVRRLCQTGWIKPTESVVLFNTGTGLKYAEAFAAYPA